MTTPGLPSSRLDWPSWAWSMWTERAGHRAAAGEPAAEADAAAERDVRAWHAAGGDRALLEALERRR